MKNFEKEYYEDDRIWRIENFSDSDRERIVETVKMIPKKVDSVADIGCGNGVFVNFLKQKGRIKTLIGIDTSASALKYVSTAKKNGDITNIPLTTKSYDLVASLEVIEHLNLKEFSKAVDELARVSKRYILISVPYKENLRKSFIDCPKCLTRFNASHHKRSFGKDYIEHLFDEKGFVCKDTKLIGRLNNYFLLSQFLSMYRKLKKIKYNHTMLCPVCGFRIENEYAGSQTKEQKKKFSLVKSFWPKTYRSKWIAALYEKST